LKNLKGTSIRNRESSAKKGGPYLGQNLHRSNFLVRKEVQGKEVVGKEGGKKGGKNTRQGSHREGVSDGTGTVRKKRLVKVQLRGGLDDVQWAGRRTFEDKVLGGPNVLERDATWKREGETRTETQ